MGNYLNLEEIEMNRRDFLKTSGILGAAMLLPLPLKEASSKRYEFTLLATQDPDRVGIKIPNGDLASLYYMSPKHKLERSLEDCEPLMGSSKHHWVGPQEVIDAIQEVQSIPGTKVITVTLQEVTIKSNRIATVRERIYKKGESGFTEKQKVPYSHRLRGSLVS